MARRSNDPIKAAARRAGRSAVSARAGAYGAATDRRRRQRGVPRCVRSAATPRGERDNRAPSYRRRGKLPLTFQIRSRTTAPSSAGPVRMAAADPSKPRGKSAPARGSSAALPISSRTVVGLIRHFAETCERPTLPARAERVMVERRPFDCWQPRTPDPLPLAIRVYPQPQAERQKRTERLHIGAAPAGCSSSTPRRARTRRRR